MSIPFSKNSKKKVSWGKQWVWKEGEEEETRIKSSAWKKKRKERRQTLSLQRDEIEQKEWDAKQTVWGFQLLKDPRVAKYIIFACTQYEIANDQLFLFLKRFDIDCFNRGLSQMLKDFRENDEITLKSMSVTNLEYLLQFFRIKAIREIFASPVQHVSSTDTDEEANGKNAAKALQEEVPAKSFDGLSEALQAVVVTYASRDDDDPPKKLASLNALRARMGLTPLNSLDSHDTTEDESHTTEYPNSSPSGSEKSHQSNNRQEEVNPTGEGAAGEESTKRQKTER